MMHFPGSGSLRDVAFPGMWKFHVAFPGFGVGADGRDPSPRTPNPGGGKIQAEEESWQRQGDILYFGEGTRRRACRAPDSENSWISS